MADRRASAPSRSDKTTSKAGGKSVGKVAGKPLAKIAKIPHKAASKRRSPRVRVSVVDSRIMVEDIEAPRPDGRTEKYTRQVIERVAAGLMLKLTSAPDRVVGEDPIRLAERMLSLVPTQPPANPMAEQVGPFYDTAGVQALLAASGEPPVSKQAVEQRRKRGTVLAMQTADGRWVYPAFQFADHRVRSDVLAALGAFSSAPAWSVAVWFTTATVELDHLSPLAWFDAGYPAEDVNAFAARTAATWAA